MPVIGTPNARFAGVRLGVGAVGVNLPVPGCPNELVPLLTHVHNALTINMQ